MERWRSRAMQVSAALLLVLVVAGAVATTLADNGTPTEDFGLVGARAEALAPALRLAARADGGKARIHRLPDRAAAERALRAGDVDLAIVGERLLVEESDSSAAVRVARRAVTGQAAFTRLRAAGFTERQALETVAPPPAQVTVLDPGARDRDSEVTVLQFGVGILLFTLIVYGQAVAASVTAEKASRVIELMLTSLSPRRLLAGKVLGVGVLGVMQVAAVCAAGLLSARLAGSEGFPPHASGTVALLVGWFVLGFAFYSVAYAALGALVSRQEDLEATTAPVNILLGGAFVGASVAIAHPDGTWAQIAAFVPPLSPLIVPTRVVLGDMGAIGLIAAVALELLATVLLIRVAAGIYERSLLRMGAPISLRSALAVTGRVAGQPRIHVPPALLLAASLAALLGGVVVGLSRPLGLALLATWLLLTLLYQHGRRHPPTHPTCVTNRGRSRPGATSGL